MSRQRIAAAGQALSERWAQIATEVEQAWAAFRESRLFVQTILALALVGIAALSEAVPAGPLSVVRDHLTAAVQQDYDFKGRAEQTMAWADARGGWGPALSGVFRTAGERFRARVGMGRQEATAKGAGTREPVTEPRIGAVAEPEPEPEPSEVGGRPDTVMPVSGPALFGYGWLPRSKQVHEGLDLAADVGETVLAMADGTVIRVSASDVLGSFVEIDHGFAVVLYGQVSAAKVKAGDAVHQSQAIAAVAKPTGQEGDSGVHLHLEVRPARGAKTVDPAPYLPLEDLSRGGSGL